MRIRDLAMMGAAWCGAGIAFDKWTLSAGGVGFLIVALVRDRQQRQAKRRAKIK